MEFKVVMSTKEGKSYQKEFKSPEADAFSKKSIGGKVLGEEVGMPGYEFQITGGSDKCGFPMRKGIQAARKKVFITGGVGYSGKDRNNKKRGGLSIRRTVCGERVTSIIHQVNVKVLKEGTPPLAPVESEQK